MPHRFEVVEEDCIGCGLCAERAPENLQVADDNRSARIIRQPENCDEEQACLDACDYCPMGALAGIDANAADSAPHNSSMAYVGPTSLPAGDPVPVGTTTTDTTDSWRTGT